MRASALWRRRLGFAFGAAATSCLVALPAAAQEDGGAGTNRLELSGDGTSFAPSLAEPLFENPPLLIPGQAASDSLWALNTSDEPAVVSLYVEDADSTLPADVPAAQDFRVLAEPAGQEASFTPIADLDPCVPIAQTELAPGENAEIALEVALPLSSGNVSQRQSVSVDFVVDLRPTNGGGARCGADPDPEPDPKPDPDPLEPGPGPGPEPQPDPDPPPTPDPDPPPTPDPNPGPPPPGADPRSPPLAQPDNLAGDDGPPLPRTGSEALPLLLTGLLALLLGAALRRSGRDPDAPPPTTSRVD